MSCALAAVLVACGESLTGGFTVADSAGIRLATAVSADWRPGDEWRLELDLQVGERDGPDAFARLGDVAPRSGGGFWTLDRQTGSVRSYDDRGSRVAGFGRRGQGPGEFSFVDHVTELPGGDVVVAGSGPVSFHRFSPLGKHRLSRVVPDSIFRRLEPDAAGPPGPAFGKWQFGPDGSPFVHTVVLAPGQDAIVRRDLLLRLSPDADAATELLDWNASVMDHGPAGEMRLLMPVAGWAPGPEGGAWWTSGETFEIRLLNGAGGLEAILRRPARPDRLSEDVQRGVLEGLSAAMDSHFEREMLDKAIFPEYLPASYGLWAGGDHMWLGVADLDLPWDYEGPNAWDVFAASGVYLGRIPIPGSFRPTRITADHVYGVWLDELDVPYARRYRIVRP